MMKKSKRYLAYVLCTAMIVSTVPPMPAMAKGQSRHTITAATNSNALKATNSNAALATASFASRAANSLGDIWDAWSGKTSFEFLDGNHGDGSEEKPFIIKNREQLMGLSELTAMGMIVPDAGGADYPGDYSGCFFALGGNIDLQGVDWIPIGFYRDAMDASGNVPPTAFTGDFNGNGYTIKNLKVNEYAGYDNVGFFGSIKDAAVHDVTIITDGGYEVNGNDHIGIAVGYAADSEIKNVTVKNGYISSTGIAGGIAGEISGTVIENCVCEKVMINATAGADIIYVGGIAGIASDSSIVDCTVSTGTGDGTASRIQGTGYIGGIVGYQNATDIYNVAVSGKIGGYHSTAIGGITGIYSAGKLKVARFSGEIGNSQLGSMAREGTFIGTRQGAATNFRYGEDVAWLFADTEQKITANVCGSETADDNDYTYADHIGYWHSSDLYFTLIQGGVKQNVSDTYFYEELENGILAIMDEEGENQYQIDHYAPNSVGQPVRGYLIVVNQIDTRANGQYFNDVATLEVRGSSQYCKTLDKEHRGAVAAGSTVHITTAPNNTDTEKYQMEGTPFYTNAAGHITKTTYAEGSHAYDFKMPAENIAVDAVYKRVAVSIKVEPEVYNFVVTQTRTGNRKSPAKTTEIRDNTGKLIARYINGVLEQGTQVQPVTIAATIDTNNDVEDSRVKWSIDDPDLVTLAKNDDEGNDGYSAKSASVAVNLDAGFFNEILQAAEQKQADENYQYKIPNTIYGAGHQNGGVAILTAETRPAASFEGKPCTANCRINVTFQILDNTLVATEGAALDKQTLEYTVTRTLTGNRTAPEEKITVTAPQSLTAVFTPDFFSRDEVTWTVSDPAVISVAQDTEAYKEASVAAYKDAKWIKDIMASDDGLRSNDKYTKISGSGKREVSVTVNGKDKLGNHAESSCSVTVQFVTDDQTRIVPEGIELNKSSLEFKLGHEKTGDINTETVARTGFTAQQLTAVVLPDLEDTDLHRPYDRTVVWTSSDPAALTVSDSGQVEAVDNAPWIKEALSNAPYSGEKTVTITAETKDGKKAAVCEVKLTFQASCIEADRSTDQFDLVLTKTGPRSAPVLAYTGMEPKKFEAALYNDNPDITTVMWASSDTNVLTVSQDGTVIPVLLDDKQEVTAEWIKEALKAYPYSGTITASITPATVDGKMKDPVNVTLTFTVVDNTYSSNGSGGSSSGGGGGSGSIGVTPSGKTQGTNAPAGSVTGSWTQAANGKWLFASGRTYANEWAFINNPYAAAGQPKASWFRFDTDGFMVTGWYTDADGNTYYLNPIPDGTQGQMLTGWQLIDEAWYYFNPVSNGFRGKLLKNTVIDGKYAVNDKGQWTEDGAVVTVK